MNKTGKRTFFTIILLIFIYFLGLIISSCTISIYPLSRQKNFHLNDLKLITQHYLDSSEEVFSIWLEGKLDGISQLQIFDAEGQPVFSASAAPQIVLSYQHHLPRVLAGEEVFGLSFVNAGTPTIHNLIGVSGVPIFENGTIVGAAFMAKKTIAVTESLIGYTVYFTLFYWLSVVIVFSVIRKKKKLDQLQHNYIANITHALKTPVTSIKALAETLCSDVEPDPDKRNTYCGMILREANRQSHMVRDILELSRLQSRSADFTKTHCNAEELLTPVLEKYNTLADCLGITLTPPDLPDTLLFLYSNAACIRQITEILLDNALKFTPEGGEIRLEIKQSKRHATFCVRDSGPGIAPDALPHVFERFFKGSHDFNAGGSGLGLAIAKELTTGLGERIWVKSAPGQGAAFYFTVRTK